MTNEPNPLAEMRTHIEQAIADLQAAIDPAALEQEKRDALAPLTTGPYKHLPEMARTEAYDNVARTQEERKGHKLFALEDRRSEDEPVLEATIAELRKAPSPLRAFSERYGSHSASDALMLGLLSEQVEARLSAQVSTMNPADALAIYEQALSTMEASGPIVIRWIEAHCATGWPGAKSSSQAQVSALTKLHKRITEVQDGRVPAECRELQALYRKARSLAHLAVDGLKVRPRKPEPTPAAPATAPRLVKPAKGAA